MADGFYRYIWRITGRQQVLLAMLAISVSVLDVAPLELQRRIINNALAHSRLGALVWLCILYIAAILALSLAKLGLYIYRGAVTESVNRRLRLQTDAAALRSVDGNDRGLNEGVEVSIVVSEVEAVGGFVGLSISEPVLHGGVLLSVFGYMLFMQPWMALVAILLFIPQIAFIPVLQSAINRRTKSRIQVLRALSADIVEERADRRDPQAAEAYRAGVDRVYGLNMQIYRRKFGMNFLMNLLYHLAIIGILLVGGWFVIQGRTQVGTVVAFISGLNRVNDPWGDLVNYFRESTNARVKFNLIRTVLRRPSAAAGR